MFQGCSRDLSLAVIEAMAAPDAPRTKTVVRPVIDHSAGEALLSAFVEVSDVNALHDSLQAAGAHIWQAPRDEPWAMRSLIISDPDGNLICFASSLAG